MIHYLKITNLSENLDKEQEYEKYYEYKEGSSVVDNFFKLKMRQSDEEQAQIKQLLDKMFQIKVIQSVIRTVNTCEQKMIEFGK